MHRERVRLASSYGAAVLVFSAAGCLLHGGIAAVRYGSSTDGISLLSAALLSVGLLFHGTPRHAIVIVFVNAPVHVQAKWIRVKVNDNTVVGRSHQTTWRGHHIDMHTQPHTQSHTARTHRSSRNFPNRRRRYLARLLSSSHWAAVT